MLVCSGVVLSLFGCMNYSANNSKSTPILHTGDTKSHDTLVSVASADNQPVLIDLGLVQTDGGTEYTYWEDNPQIEGVALKARERVDNITSLSNKIIDVSVSTFDLDDRTLHELHTYDCQLDSGDSSGTECKIEKIDNTIYRATLMFELPCFATMQIIDGSTPHPEQSTWLL